MTEKHIHVSDRTHTSAFVAVFIMLCALTGVSYWIANSNLMVESRSLARGCLIAVSAAKAFLVVVFFMHLWWERNWKYALTLPAIVLASVLVLLLIPDIGLRTKSYSTDRMRHAPIPQTSTQTTDQLDMDIDEH